MPEIKPPNIEQGAKETTTTKLPGFVFPRLGGRIIRADSIEEAERIAREIEKLQTGVVLKDAGNSA